MTFDTNGLVALAAFAIGIAFGALTRWSGFCLRGAVEDALTTPDAPRLRGFLAAMVVALIVVVPIVWYRATSEVAERNRILPASSPVVMVASAPVATTALLR